MPFFFTNVNQLQKNARFSKYDPNKNCADLSSLSTLVRLRRKMVWVKIHHFTLTKANIFYLQQVFLIFPWLPRLHVSEALFRMVS